MGVFKTSRYGYGRKEWRDGWVLVFWLSVIAALLVVVIGVGTEIGRNFSESRCNKWGEVNESVEVEFVNWHFFSWDCMVLTDDGVAVPEGQWRANLDGVKD
jgi:hypothetical protein